MLNPRASLLVAFLAAGCAAAAPPAPVASTPVAADDPTVLRGTVVGVDTPTFEFVGRTFKPDPTFPVVIAVPATTTTQLAGINGVQVSGGAAVTSGGQALVTFKESVPAAAPVVTMGLVSVTAQTKGTILIDMSLAKGWSLTFSTGPGGSLTKQPDGTVVTKGGNVSLTMVKGVFANVVAPPINSSQGLLVGPTTSPSPTPTPSPSPSPWPFGASGGGKLLTPS